MITFILHVGNGNPERAEDHENGGSGIGTRVFQYQTERRDLLPGPDGLRSHPVSHHTIFYMLGVMHLVQWVVDASCLQVGRDFIQEGVLFFGVRK